jgi:AraC-like DNA-binding protein
MMSRLIPFQPNLPVAVDSLICKIEKWNHYSKKDLAVMSQFTTGDAPKDVELIPDNCIEFIFIINDNPKAILKGPIFKTEMIKLEPNTTYFNFKPTSISGTVLAKLGLKELQDQRIPFETVFKETSIIEDIAKASDFTERVNIFKDYAKTNVLSSKYKHPFAEHIQRIICDGAGSEQVNSLASKIGFSSRYCTNKFKDNLGISIKSYSNIIRFQNIMRCFFKNSDVDFRDVIMENNLYDQAHLIHIIQRYTGYSPKEYMKKINSQSKAINV